MGLFDLIGPIGGQGTMTDAERRAFMLQMLDKLEGGVGKEQEINPQFSFPLVPPQEPDVNVGAGQSEASSELLQALDIIPSATPEEDQFGAIRSQVRTMSPEELIRLEQMLSSRMNAFNQLRFGR